MISVCVEVLKLFFMLKCLAQNQFSNENLNYVEKWLLNGTAETNNSTGFGRIVQFYPVYCEYTVDFALYCAIEIHTSHAGN